MGFEEDWPSAAYEEVMESITDWAFSWPISGILLARSGERDGGRQGERKDGHTLVVLDDVTQMVSTAVVSFADAHGVVREVHIAVVACRRSV